MTPDGDRRLRLQRTLAPWLAPLGWCWGRALAVRRGAYRRGLVPRVRAAVPVISVGSLTAGGAGKTPFVRLLAQRCADRRVAILSRGYGGRYRGMCRVSADGDAKLFGDEPVLLARTGAAAVWVGRDRAALAQHLGSRYDLLLLDDGYQHLKLARDLDVCLVPAGSATSVLPAGLLRESPAALKDADYVLGVDGLPDWIEDHYAGPVGVVSRLPAVWCSDAPDPEPPRRVFAFSGIARPERFRADLDGHEVVGEARFADHHAYRPRQLEALWRQAEKAGAAALVTTAKDAVRIGTPPPGLPLFWRDITLRWERGEAEFVRALQCRVGVPKETDR